MVRRDREADGGFGQFFSETVERAAAVDEVSLRRAAEASAERGLTDSMGELNLPRTGSGGDVAPRSPFLADTTCWRVIRGVEHEAGPRAASERRESAAPRSGSADAGRSASGVRGYHAYQAYVTETGGADPRVDRAGAKRSGGPGDSPASLA